MLGNIADASPQRLQSKKAIYRARGKDQELESNPNPINQSESISSSSTKTTVAIHHVFQSSATSDGTTHREYHHYSIDIADKPAQNVIFKNLQQVCSTFTTDFSYPKID